MNAQAVVSEAEARRAAAAYEHVLALAALYSLADRFDLFITMAENGSRDTL